MRVKIRQPDDFHVHLRQGQMLKDVLPFTANIFNRVVVMGNTQPPIITANDVHSYRNEIVSQAVNFQPLMSVMLVNCLTREILQSSSLAGAKVLKLIPGKTSTGSDHGIALTALTSYYPVLELAAELGMIFSVHLELIADPETGKEIPEFDREKQAIPFLLQLIKDLPQLKIVVEHVTTKELIELIKQSPDNIAATITAHHLYLTYDNVCNQNRKIINPYNYCKPIAKSKQDQQALIATATSGSPKFFFGSDSAPHLIVDKEKEIPNAGIFSAPVVLPLLAEIFELNEALDRLEDFVSRFGAEFYELPLTDQTISLSQKDWLATKVIKEIAVFNGGQKLSWQVE